MADDTHRQLEAAKRRRAQAAARRRQARIDEATDGLISAMRQIELFVEVAAREGLTQDGTCAHLPEVRRRIIAAAQQIELFEVYGEIDDGELGRLLGDDA